MAMLPGQVVKYANCPPYIPYGYNLTGPVTKEEKGLCKKQKIRSSSGVESSVLGVAIILFVGALLIVPNLVLDTLVRFVGTKTYRNEYQTSKWTSDDEWQRLRLASEGAGQGQWTGGASAVPATSEPDKAGVPRNADMIHPCMGKAGA